MSNNNQPFSEKKVTTTKGALGCLTVFFSIFLIIGLSLGWKLFIDPIIKIIQSQTWVETACTIISSEVAEKDDSDETTYKVDIKYKYKFNDVAYESKQYNFINTYSSGRKSKVKVVKEYPPNKTTVCYVNPDNPTQAVIYRGLEADFIYIIVPMLFVLVGAGGIGFAINSLKQSTPILATNPASAKLAQSDQPINTQYFTKENIELKPAVLPYHKVLGIGFFCLFWNGIVIIFVVNMSNNGSSLFEKIFFSPFVLIGLGFVYLLFTSVKTIFAPQPKFFIDRPFVGLGNKLKLSWIMDSNPASFRAMTIQLEAYEESKYRKGTDTYTDKQTFYQKMLLKTSEPSEMAKSEVIIDIPKDSVPSFTAENNRIVWSISAKVMVEGWADFTETYEITVTPANKY